MGILELLSPNDPEFAKKTVGRLRQQDEWNDIFATKLIEILDKLDAFQARVRDQLVSVAEMKRLKTESELALGSFDKVRTAATRLDQARATLETATTKADDARKFANDAMTTYTSAQNQCSRAETALSSAVLDVRLAQEQAEAATRQTLAATHAMNSARAEAQRARDLYRKGFGRLKWVAALALAASSLSLLAFSGLGRRDARLIAAASLVAVLGAVVSMFPLLRSHEA